MKKIEKDQSRLFNSIIFSGIDFKARFNKRMVEVTGTGTYFNLRVRHFWIEEITIETKITEILKKKNDK
jgi:hypothetical protein